MVAVFDCRMCGHCCEGRGGIVLGGRDIARLAHFLGQTEADFCENSCEEMHGKLMLATGADGYCLFFRQGSGCVVHDAKPDVCRAWPFFRGNLEDSHSLALAADFCPGINPEVSFEEFAEAGRRYLLENGLASETGPANALRIAKVN